MSFARRSLAVLVLGVLTGTAGAQTAFKVLIDGRQETPPNTSPHTGTG